MNPILLILAVVPGLLICFLIFRTDRYEKEPKLLMLASFVLGALITYPTMKLEELASTLGWEHSSNFFKLFFFSVVFVGLIEEAFKFLCLMVGPYLRKAFSEPLDGIVYAIFIAMGFATVENILYADRFGIQTVALRGLTAVPAHAAFAVIMGYYVGLAKFNKKDRIKYLLLGLGISSLVHGLYDFFILQTYFEWLITFASLVLVVALYFSYKLTMKHLATSHQLSEERAAAALAKASNSTSEDPTDQDLIDEIFKEMRKEEQE